MNLEELLELMRQSEATAWPGKRCNAENTIGPDELVISKAGSTNEAIYLPFPLILDAFTIKTEVFVDCALSIDESNIKAAFQVSQDIWPYA